MGNEKYISLLKNDNKTIFAELLCSFYLEEYNSDYIIYSLNKLSWNNKTIIHIGKIKRINDKDHLTNIDSYQEWDKVRKIIATINKYGTEGVING